MPNTVFGLKVESVDQTNTDQTNLNVTSHNDIFLIGRVLNALTGRARAASGRTLGAKDMKGEWRGRLRASRSKQRSASSTASTGATGRYLT